MTHKHVDVVIIGGGVLGCAIARILSAQRRSVVLLEKEPDVGLHASGRNSGIVHSGFHQKPGSLAARLCIEGHHAIRKYAELRRIPFQQVGTYVVASDESDVSVLEDLKGRGDRNGVHDLQLLSVSRAKVNEPNLQGHTALYAPTDAIIDSRTFTKALADDAVRSGTQILYWQEVVDIEERADAVHVSTLDEQYVSEIVINCAGLHAERLAHEMGVGRDYFMVPLRGIYFTVTRSGPPLIQSIIYPVQDFSPPFMGVSIARTVHGAVLVGPSTVPDFRPEAYQRKPDRLGTMAKLASRQAVWKAVFRNRKLLRLGWKHDTDTVTQQYFWKEASRVIDGLQLQDLSLGNRVGMTPQLIRSDGQLIDDLVVESTERTIHVLNMVSPGMTCALSFAKWLTDRMHGVGQGAKFKTPSLASVS
ncbi:MAG: hydroxyglutarate oxidase [Nitrospirales bacterium]|nr:MAG: hydroxyglutarate oxidase [Nitrospirales bacterium]